MAEEVLSGIRSLNEPHTLAINAGVEPPDPGPLAATSLNPAEAEWGGPDVECHVIGTGFTLDSVITVAGADAETKFYSREDISTTMLASTMTAASTVPVTVKRPMRPAEEKEAPRIEETNPLDFAFTDPAELREAEHETEHKTPKTKHKSEQKTKHSWR